MSTERKIKLVLEDGREFHGAGYGANVPAVGEIVFNTSMVGYQEIISDPAYAGQIVVMTYPLMGQYGITDEDFESRTTGPAGLVVRECCETPSNFRYTKTLSEELEEHGTPCISGLDTRMLTRIIRTKGSLKAAIVDEDMSVQDALEKIASSKEDKDLVKKVSCSKRWFSRTPQHKCDVVIIDCGLKHSIISSLNRLGCNVTVVPFNATEEEIMAFNPDGILISSGPGSPEDLPELVALVGKLRSRVPVFGICLGHGIVALSYGAKVVRLPYGHHGGRPIREKETGRILTVEHNHNYTVDAASLEGTGLEVTYTDISDGSVEGIRSVRDKVLSVQFYPEGAPGPEEEVFFKEFVKMMED